MHCAVAITSIGSPSTQQPSRIAILSSEGDVLIIDIEAATAAGGGGGGGGGSTTYMWTIMAHIQVRGALPCPALPHAMPPILILSHAIPFVHHQNDLIVCKK